MSIYLRALVGVALLLPACDDEGGGVTPTDAAVEVDFGVENDTSVSPDPDAEVTPDPDAIVEVDAVVDAAVEVDSMVEVDMALDAAVEVDMAVDAMIEEDVAIDAAVEVDMAVDAAIDMDTAIDAAVEVDMAIDAAVEVDMAIDAAVEIDMAVDAAIEDDAAVEVDMAVDAAIEDDAAGPICVEDGDCAEGEQCVEGACVDPNASPLAGALILNEILIDGTTDEDANGDGDIDGMEDEFIELVNVSDAPLDLSGCVVSERDLVLARHTFPEGFTLEAGRALVIFGGGQPSEELEDSAPQATFIIADSADPAFSFGLNLDDDGDILSIHDAEGRLVLEFTYGDACGGAPGCAPTLSERSLTRAPELEGAFEPHPEPAIFSPGLRADGQPF